MPFPWWVLIPAGLVTLLALLFLALVIGGSIVWRSTAGRGWRW